MRYITFSAAHTFLCHFFVAFWVYYLLFVYFDFTEKKFFWSSFFNLKILFMISVSSALLKLNGSFPLYLSLIEIIIACFLYFNVALKVKLLILYRAGAEPILHFLVSRFRITIEKYSLINRLFLLPFTSS